MLSPLSAFDFERIYQARERILAASAAPNTRSTYASGWRVFARWCQAARREALPASPETLEEFVIWLLVEGYRVKTAESRVHAVAARHRDAGFPSPFEPRLRALFACARRELQEPRQCKRALTYEQLSSLAPEFPAKPAGVRDRAMVLLGFASGWRRSEVVALDLCDIEFRPEGLSLWQGRSKTDQAGVGRLVGITPGKRPETCPLRALRAWLDVRGDWEGPLFVRMNFRGQPTRERLCGRGIRLCLTLKERLAALGEDPREYGAHSLRAGMITEAAKAGASEIAIMQRTGHKRSETIQRYIRPATVFDFDPLKNVL